MRSALAVSLMLAAVFVFADGRQAQASPIKHIVIIVQENRSLDNLFNGFPGADTVRYGRNHLGQLVQLKATPFVELYDPDHEHVAWVADYDRGKMDGFDLPPTSPMGPANFNYGYVPQSETKPYWTMAQQYVLANRMFASEAGPSFPAHQYLIAGQSARTIGNPNDPFFRWGCDAQAGTTTPILEQDGTVDPNGPFPCFKYRTMADLLDHHGVSWTYYTNLEEKEFGAGVQPFDAIAPVRYGPDWNKVVAPQVQIFWDLFAGNLASVSWVNPPLVASDHAQTSTNYGPDWVGTIVNAIGSSPYWNDTAILVTWDDWGGWYDHVPPPQLDAMGLSFRVPLLVVSPYAKQSYVSHTRHEFGSILKFTEETFGLGSLGQTDTRADDLRDCFNFRQTPRQFQLIPTSVGIDFFEKLPPGGPIDY